MSSVCIYHVVSKLEDRKHDALFFRPKMKNVIATPKSLVQTERSSLSLLSNH
ncbi:hypothetical protein Plhal304r1_c023g0079451 [Plasmopara halstedii]